MPRRHAAVPQDRHRTHWRRGKLTAGRTTCWGREKEQTMATRFLELKDGVIVEIGSPGEAREEMHTSSAERVDTTMEMVATMLDRILRPIGDAFAGLHEALDVPVAVDAAEVKLGLSF